MNANDVLLTREALYDLVWSEPMQKLARRFGYSDRGLAKTCARMRVPVPSRGYWALKAVGRAPKREPLPELPPNSSLTPTQITLREVSEAEAMQSTAAEAPQLPEPVALQAAYEADPKNRISVPATLRTPHRLVQQTLESLRAESERAPDDWRFKPGPRLTIDVSKPLLKRGLRIMDTLLKAFDRREWKVTLSRHGDSYQPHYVTFITVLDQQVYFGISEPIRRVRNTPTAEDKGKPTRQLGWHKERSGRLALVIYRDAGEYVELETVETESAPLESQLNDFILRLVSIAHERAEVHRKQVEEWKRQMAEEDRKQAERRRREDEAAKGRALEQQALDWALGVNLLAYVAELRTAADRRREPIEPESTLAQWLDWAEAYAKARDPLVRPLEELAAARVPAPNPYAVPTAIEVAKPQTPFWFIRNR